MSPVSLLVMVPALLVTITAGDPPIAAVPDTKAIAGGETVATCGWPSVVVLRGNGYLCSGNLITPEIVATAAHCIEVMEPNTRVYFGDTANTAKEKVAVEYCLSSPDFVSNGDGTIPFAQVGNDWGFCKLAAPVTDVEPIPPIYGCELDLVQPGAEIVRVGFGKETLATNQFFKRWVETTIVSVPFLDANGWPKQLSEGGGGQGTCPGDSGGPSFIRVPAASGGDDSWRMVAIQSTQPIEDAQGNPIECGTEPNNTAVLSQGLGFIEMHSSVDVTPCFDIDGSWDPTFECAGFVQDPGLGGGNWTMGCHPGPLGDFSAACGEAFDQLYPDLTAPTVTIVEPPGPVDLPWPGDAVTISVLVDADDGDGWGVSHVELVILDASTRQELAVFDSDGEPHAWDPAFPQGTYLIKAIARDNAGLTAETPTRPIDIGVEPPASDDGSSEGDDTGDDEGSSGGVDDTSSSSAEVGNDPGGTGGSGDGSETTVATDSGDGGCSCRSSASGSGSAPTWLVVVMLLVCCRRRQPE